MNTIEDLVWTKELPKEIGVYWRRHLSSDPNLPAQDKQLCILIRRDGEFWITATREKECGTPLKWFDPKYTEWCGPVNPGSPTKKEICPICGYPSSSIDCHKWWEGI